MNTPSPTLANKKSFKDWQYAFTSHIRDPKNVAIPDGMEARRIKIYSDLFYNNVEGFISDGFPVLRSLYNEDDWHVLVRDYFKVHKNHTPYFLELSQEFLAYLQNEREDNEDDFPFMIELAHYEWVELALSIDETEIDLSKVDNEGDLLEGHPIISPLAWPLSYNFEVHKISADTIPTEASAQPTHLIVYRDHEDEVRFMEINPVTARLLFLLAEDQALTGRAALQQISEELQHPDANAVIDGGISALNELQQRGIILGTAK
ncbi:MAG: putative DNA-binding domain-containing protein [Sulfuriflexus sp.]|nr:putative DNA-binding domain-containing protein [Sulfuriflexus sp.]